MLLDQLYYFVANPIENIKKYHKFVETKMGSNKNVP